MDQPCVINLLFVLISTLTFQEKSPSTNGIYSLEGLWFNVISFSGKRAEMALWQSMCHCNI